MRALNMGRPSIEDIKDYGQHIVQKTYLWTDGLQSYSVLSTEKQCTIKQMKDRKQYDAVNHLNHVNSLHSRIKAQYKRYRSVASKYITLCSTVPDTRAVPKNKWTGNDHELIDEAQAFAYNILHPADTK